MTGDNSRKMTMTIKQYMVTKNNRFKGLGDYSNELFKEIIGGINELAKARVPNHG
jgi:hypothetical protein